MTAAEDKVTALETAFTKNLAVVSVEFDGIKTTYDRKQLLAELNYWKKVVAEEAGNRPRFSSISLNS